MSSERISIPGDLMRLKPSAELTSVSMSSLARKGTAVLRQLTDSAQAVAVTVQGQGAMVTLSQRQYDEMISLLQQLQQTRDDDGFTRALAERFDSLLASMNRSGATEATDAALFADTGSLNASYRPGSTETAIDIETDTGAGSGQVHEP